MKDIDYSYTMEKAFKDAKEYYKINGNRKIIHKKFHTCESSLAINKYVDECKAKYFNIPILSYEKEIDWINGTTDVIFTIQLKDEELENEIKELAGEFYRAVLINIMEKALENKNIKEE